MLFASSELMERAGGFIRLGQKVVERDKAAEGGLTSQVVHNSTTAQTGREVGESANSWLVKSADTI